MKKRLNSLVGQDSRTLVEKMGPPRQIVRFTDDSSLWVYPVNDSLSSGLALDDDDSAADGAWRKELPNL